ncbi:MAG: membrane protein insertase YidC [Candidatus Izimaplasma sp.]|nr:membrane protein insertase YidC [Candidatus Izimaplasma bacterium]
MKNSTRIQLLIATAILVLFLSGCKNTSDMYTSPIGIEGGVGWVQWIVLHIADFTYWISNSTGGYYFVGLIIVTFIVRTAGWPIYSKSNAMTMKMQQAQPELDKIKEKYQGKTDETSQKKMQAETLEVYKKYNINPLGCLLPFLQMPIFIAMYQVVRRIPLSDGMVDGVITEGVRDFSDLNFSFLWISDLGGADQFYILPVLVGVLMFLYQRYSMKKPEYLQNKKYQSSQGSQSEKTMKMMSYFMVVMLVWIAKDVSGIALYWIVGNAYQFLQTYLNRRSNSKKIEKEKERF